MKTEQETLEDLQTLFEFVSPIDLKGTIINLLMQNLLLASNEERIEKVDPENIALLINFLDSQKDSEVSRLTE